VPINAPTPTPTPTPTPAGGGVTPDGSTLPPPVSDAGVQARNEAADLANAAAGNALDAGPTGDIDIRDSATILAGIQDTMEGITPDGTEAPEPPNMADVYETTRLDLGIEPLETELAGIDSEIEAINANLLIESEKAGEKLVSMREIGRDKGQLQKEAERNIALLNIERSAVSRILNNKLNTLKITMDLTGQDFANASTTYQNEFNRNVQLYNLMAGAEEREITHAERLRDDARANLTTISNIFTKSGVVWADLTEDNKTKIKALEIQAGYPEGLSEALMSMDSVAEKERSFQIVSDDKTQVTVFYKDGTSQTFSTGISPTPETPGTGSKWEQLQSATQDMHTALSGAVDTNGFVTNHQWNQAKDAWIAEGLDPNEFIKRFYKFIYPPAAKEYGPLEDKFISTGGASMVFVPES